MSTRLWGRLGKIGFAVLPLGLALSAEDVSAATYRFDNFAGDGQWETISNWRESVAGTHLAEPTAADIADVSSNFTATLSSPRSVSELFVAHPNASAISTAGTATVNIQPGATLTVGSTNGMRVGRALKSVGGVVGDSKGVVIQTGGSVLVPNGTNGLRLSQGDATPIADSLYRISGGVVRGGAAVGATGAPLQVGRVDASFLTAEFNVVGSLATDIRFEDIRVAGSTSNAGQAILHFSLDAAGVTTMFAEDEMRFVGTGSNILLVDMIGPAPEADIFLIRADRLSTATSAPAETFSGLPDGSLIYTTFGPDTWEWRLRYQDGADDANIDAYVKLEFVAKGIPEPGALALAAAAGMMALRRRRP